MLHQLRVQCPTGKVVAVVGMAHMDGIENEWRKSAKAAPEAEPVEGAVEHGAHM